jgi:chromosome partitioning protein
MLPIDSRAEPPTSDAAVLERPVSQKRRAARILSIVNQKGGVGKTTTAINLATALAAAHKRILVIDFDPQGNASTGLGIPRQARSVTSYDVLLADRALADAITPTNVPGLFVVPASVDLSGAEIELVELQKREFRLRDALNRATLDFDYVLIDCPPSLGLLTLNALVACHAVLVPLQCEFYALEGLSHLVRTIDRVKRSLNPGLEIQGVVLTMFDKRNNLSDLVAADVRGHFGAKVYDTVIPRNVRISEAPSHGKPVLLYDFRCPGSQAYIHLAGEVLRRELPLSA